VTKTLVLYRGRYDIDVHFRLDNGSSETWVGSRYDQLQRAAPEDEDSGGFTNPERYSFFGIGFYNPDDKFEKIKFEDVGDTPYQVTARGGWLAMIQHYFFAAWIPPAEEEATFSTQLLQTDAWPRYIARNVSPAQQAAPGAHLEFSSRLYLGPKLQDNLPDIAPGLEYTVNYGIFTVFSKPLFWLLEKIHDVVGNWGWAIVLLTIMIKVAFFKLTEAQYRSTARMRKLQPRIESLKERYGDDRQRMSQAMMELYKKEKVNPLGGCLPILVQIPIFIALYWVLLESVELRQAPFVLWIDNLSVRDPYFVLPLLNAGFMFATQRLTPMVGMDPLQQKMMTMMPIVFSIMFAFFQRAWCCTGQLTPACRWRSSITSRARLPRPTDTICAIATPPGAGGVGIVRISGPLAPDIARAMAGRLPAPRYATLAAFSDAGGEVIDTGIALFFPAPASFTGEDVVELQGRRPVLTAAGAEAPN
jgi:YidC/Oxa1 family membrane protein insertase